MTSEEGWTPPPSYPFDRNAERRAFRWAVARAGLVLVVIFAVASSLLGFLSAIVFHFAYPDSMRRFETALSIAHPELQRVGGGSGAGKTYWRNKKVSTFGYLEGGEIQHTEIALERTLWGTASAKIPTTALADGLALGRVPLRDARTYVAAMPEAAVADVVVELREGTDTPPSSVAEVGGVLRCVAQYMENPFAGARRFEREIGNNTSFTDDSARRSTPTSECYGTKDFQRWVGGLGWRDDAVLEAVSLPRRAELQKIANDGLVYGFYLRALSKAELLKLMVDPAVATVTPIKVSLAPARLGRERTAPPAP
ncbi:MAG: hypothetical protein QOJ92_304 [Frankiales bacterium]|nr:hypothetical protein [Frankiales bacterium]